MSESSITASTAIQSVPDLSLNVTVTDATAGVAVSTDGGVQLGAAAAGLFANVEISLIVDSPATAQTPASSRTIARRRVFIANAVAQQAVTNWSMTVVDVEPPGGPYTYRVTAQLIQNNSAAPVIISGSSTALPWLRGTLTALVVNK